MASTAAPGPARRRAGNAEPEQRDSAVDTWRLTPKLSRRVALVSALLLVVFAALLLRLWTLQVLAGSAYAAKAQANQLRTVPVPAPRGPIVDRNGDVLVTNQPVTSVELYPASLPHVYANRVAELRALAHVTRVHLSDITHGIVKLRKVNDMLDPVVVRPQASAALVTYLEERAGDFPGVTLERNYVRKYPHGDLAAQLLGHDGQISAGELKTLSKQGYQPGEIIGQTGVEAAFNSYLQGVPGTARVRVDSFGRPISGRKLVTPAQSGQTVRLTISTKLQLAAENALQYGINLAHGNKEWYADGGAIVAMNPRNGAILAMASAPTYNPAIYSGRLTQKTLNLAGLGTPQSGLDRNYPALNRAIDVTYPPGSVFKPFTAIAALQQHLINPYAYYHCTGTYTAPEDLGHHVFHNWDPLANQWMDLPTAIAYSCDTYFYRVGNAFYLLPKRYGQPLQRWAAAFGFGRSTGIDVGPEATGLLPTIGWKHRTFTAKTDPTEWQIDRLWKPGDSIQLAIGQGDLLATPVQLARAYAAIANGGKLVTPHVLLDVENPNHTLVPTVAAPAPRQIQGLDPANLQIVQQGMYEGTHMPFGTSYGVFGNFPIPIAGKTGTAQKIITLPGFRGELNQSVFCGYGPVPNPKLVVCALIENGGYGGKAAAPAAERVFAKYFGVQPGHLGVINSD